MTNNQQGKDGANRFEVRTTAESHFSWLRTRMSVERTLMSWIRTATALIGFGFTIVQFFERFKNMAGVAPAVHPEAPRYLGLALIGAGVLGLIIALWEYHRVLSYLWHDEFKPVAGMTDTPVYTPLVAIAFILTLIGVFAFVAVLLRFP